jgi:dTDP-4-dehydrorhamnose reductase
VFAVHRKDLEPGQSEALTRRFKSEHPALILHCAALSRSVDCENDPVLARKVNVELTARLSELARETAFLHFSTDLVFDGERGHYNETDPINPLGPYAQTKAEAEHAVLANHAHTVVRTSLNVGTSPTGDRAFNEVMRREWESGRTVRLFTDEFRCPIPAAITARAVWELAVHGRPGLYHLAGVERLSRWQIGQLFAKRWPHLAPRIESGSLRDYRGAPRSPDTSLDCTRIQSLLSFPLPGLTAYLETVTDNTL